MVNSRHGLVPVGVAHTLAWTGLYQWVHRCLLRLLGRLLVLAGMLFLVVLGWACCWLMRATGTRITVTCRNLWPVLATRLGRVRRSPYPVTLATRPARTCTLQRGLVDGLLTRYLTWAGCLRLLMVGLAGLICYHR